MGNGYVIVVAKPYYKGDLEIDNYLRIKAGRSGSIEFEAINKGNSRERFRIEIFNRKDLEDRGWIVELSKDKMEIEHLGTSLGTLDLTIPENEKPGTYELKVAFLPVNSVCLDFEDNSDGYTVKRIIEIEVLNNYKDEVITGAIIGGPIALILLVVISIVLIIRRKRR